MAFCQGFLPFFDLPVSFAFGAVFSEMVRFWCDLFEQ
jgi:hypothetical protein